MNRPGPDPDAHVREAVDADDDAIAVIYGTHVRQGLASFEEIPPTSAQMRQRRAAVGGAGLPWLVAERDGLVLGYAYAAPYRERSAYRFSLEDSVYVRAGLGGGGVGSALLAALLARCERGPWRQMIAVIGDSDNHGSIRLHARHGFVRVGTLHAVGFKHGRWVDSVMMQRALGRGDHALPDVAPRASSP